MTCTLRFKAIIRTRCEGELDYIMHSGDKQDLDNLARPLHNPRRDLMYHTRRDLMRNRCCMYSRDRNRRT